MNARERGDWQLSTARQIKAERAAAGWTQDEMVAHSGIPKSTYRKLENGSRVADITQIARIANAIGVSVPEFFRRVDMRRGDPAPVAD